MNSNVLKSQYPAVSGMVSVVIPCRNEASAIEDTLDAVFRSDFLNLEVLVVDGMSDDGTREILRRLQSKFGGRLRIIDNPHKLTPFAFNLGVMHAKGEFIQIIGSRNIISPTYISTLVDSLKIRPDVACVGGDYQHVFSEEGAKYIARAMESKFGVGSGNYRTMTEDHEVDIVGVPLYRRATIEEVGFFDQDLTRNQDDEFNFRLRAKGYRILYIHSAKVTYLVRSSLKKAFMQFFQYGYFKVLVNRKHKTVTTLRQLLPAAFVVFLILSPLLIVVLGFEGASFLLGVGLLYALLGLLMSGKGLTVVQRFGVLRACFVLHTAYGLGYLQGIWDFLICGRQPRTTFQRQTV